MEKEKWIEEFDNHFGCDGLYGFRENYLPKEGRYDRQKEVKAFIRKTRHTAYLQGVCQGIKEMKPELDIAKREAVEGAIKKVDMIGDRVDTFDYDCPTDCKGKVMKSLEKYLDSLKALKEDV